MKKEVMKPRAPDGVKYRYAGKESLLETLAKIIPKEAKPTKKTGYAFGAIFLLVVIVALLKFPLGSMMKGDANVSIEVGIPMVFLEFNLMDPSEPPARIGGLIVDMILYLFIAYAIDVILNLAINSRLMESKEEKKKRPKVFKSKKQSKTIAEKLTDKFVKKSIPLNTPRPPAPQQ